MITTAPVIPTTLKLTVPPGTSSGKKLRLRGKGAHKDKTERGDLYAVTSIQVPSEVPDKAKELISEFAKITGVPVLLNTSFNENEPIVDTPEQALDCFLRTRMDAIVVNNTIIRRLPRANSLDAVVHTM